jgi:hypothetical protein
MITEGGQYGGVTIISSTHLSLRWKRIDLQKKRKEKKRKEKVESWKFTKFKNVAVKLALIVPGEVNFENKICNFFRCNRFNEKCLETSFKFFVS